VSDNPNAPTSDADEHAVQPERPWEAPEPGRLVSRGHAAGDVLEAYEWSVQRREPGLLVVEAHLPDALRNPQGQLFGGFTPAYVDFVSLHTVHTTEPDHDDEQPRNWLTTINMRCDYFEPIMGPSFTVTGEVVNQRGLTTTVSTKFHHDDLLCAYGLTTLRTIPAVKVQAQSGTIVG